MMYKEVKEISNEKHPFPRNIWHTVLNNPLSWTYQKQWLNPKNIWQTGSLEPPKLMDILETVYNDSIQRTSDRQVVQNKPIPRTNIDTNILNLCCTQIPRTETPAVEKKNVFKEQL